MVRIQSQSRSFVSVQVGAALRARVVHGTSLQNTYLMMAWLLEIAAYINCSFNIFVYYSMGSRYRETMNELFCKSRRITAKSANRDTGQAETVSMAVSTVSSLGRTASGL